MKEQDVFVNFSGLCTEQYEPLSNLLYLALCPRKWISVNGICDASRSPNLCSIFGQLETWEVRAERSFKVVFIPLNPSCQLHKLAGLCSTKGHRS